MLTVGIFLLTVEPFYLQLAIVASLLTIGAFHLHFSFFTYNWQVFAYSEKVRLISTLRDCKQRSSAVSKKAPTVSKKNFPLFDLIKVGCVFFHPVEGRAVLKFLV